MHLLTIVYKLINYGNKLFEVDCPQLGIFIQADTQEEILKKMTNEFSNYFDIADVKIMESEQEKDIVTHNILLKVAR